MIRNLLRNFGVGLLGAIALRELRRIAMRRLELGEFRDRLGERVIKRASGVLGHRLRGKRLRRAALIRDFIGNTMFFSLLFGARRPKHPLVRGLIGGSTAGLGTAILRRTLVGKKGGPPALTAGLYLASGLAAATAWRGLHPRGL